MQNFQYTKVGLKGPKNLYIPNEMATCHQSIQNKQKKKITTMVISLIVHSQELAQYLVLVGPHLKKI